MVSQDEDIDEFDTLIVELVAPIGADDDYDTPVDEITKRFNQTGRGFAIETYIVERDELETFPYWQDYRNSRQNNLPDALVHVVFLSRKEDRDFLRAVFQEYVTLKTADFEKKSDD